MTWTEFKTIVNNLKLKVQLVKERSNFYKIVAYNGPRRISTTIKKTSPASADQTDFETNFLPKIDKEISPPKDFYIETSNAKLESKKSVNKFGSNTAVGASFQQVWNSGVDYSYPTSDTKINVSSTNANDTATGTGARTVKIFGLDTNHEEQNETITLNGTTSVQTTKNYIRIFRATVLSAGTGEENQGNIEFKSATTSDLLAEIPQGNNQTLMAIYTVPSGKVALLSSYYSSIPKDSEVEVRLRIRFFGEVFQTKHQIFIYESYMRHEFDFPILIDEKSDIELSVRSKTGLTCSVSGGFDLVLVDKND